MKKITKTPKLGLIQADKAKNIVFKTAFLKKFVLDQQLKTCGFNGVMFSLLEDKLLVKENK